MKALRGLLRTSLNLDNNQVVPSNKPFPRGGKPFITVNLVTSQPIGVGKRDFLGDEETEVIRTSFDSLVSLNFYGENANAFAIRAQAILQSSFVQAELHKLNTALYNTSAIRDLSGSLGAGYEERAQLDLNFSHTHITTTPFNKIDTAPLIVDSEKHKTQTLIEEK